jgi:YggT family protein
VIVSSLVTVVNVVFQLASLAILARVILSWLPMAGVRIDPYHPVIRILYQITDPILDPIRRFATFGMIDFSPIVALILLEVIRRVLLSALIGSL